MGGEGAIKRVLDGALDAVVATDRGGAIVGWNRAAEALFGWARDEVLGRPVHELIVPARDREVFVKRLGAITNGEIRDRHECTLVDRGGREFPVDVGAAATETDGCVIATAFIRDISERKRGERLRENQHRLAQPLVGVRGGRELATASQRVVGEGLRWATVEGYMLDGDDELRLIARWGSEARPPAAELAEKARQRRGLVVEPGALAMPASVAGEIVAVTVLRDAPDRQPRADEIAVLANITRALEQYGERRRAEWRLERETIAVAQVTRATRRLSTATTSAAARQALCDAARQVCKSSIAFLAEPDPQAGDDELVITATSGETPSSAGLPGRVGPGTAIHRVYATGAPLFIGDAQTDPLASNDAARLAGVRSALAHPLLRKDQVIGVLGMSWGERVEHASESIDLLVGMLADEGAIALSRAEAYTSLATAARTDPLTGLPNLRGWDEALARELARAGRTGGPFSVALLDIDGFKAINDSGGHQAGDRMLRAAVSAWMGTVRTSDLIARLGGDEFGVALPDCDRD